MKVTNKSDETKTNIKITPCEQDLFDITDVVIDGSIIGNIDNIVIPELEKGCEVEIAIYIVPKGVTTDDSLLNLYFNVTNGEKALRTNKLDVVIKKIDLQIDLTANNIGEEIKPGEEINYTITVKNGENSADLDKITVADTMFGILNIKEIKLDGKKLQENEYGLTSVSNEMEIEEQEEIVKKGQKELVVYTDIKVGETKVLEVKSVVSEEAGYMISKTIEITNKANLSMSNGTNVESNEVIHVLNPTGSKVVEAEDRTDRNPAPDYPDTPNTPNNPNNSDTPNTPNNPNIQNGNNDSNKDKKEKKYTISGMAWFDENENGVKDGTEQRLSGITAKLMNLKTNEIKETKTSDSGFYSFTGLSNGDYVVIFEYDKEKYMLTSYQAEGVSSNSNSDVENVTMKIDGTDKKVSSTDTLKINNNSITDVDLGLLLAKVFDLELTKTISKVSITNDEGTETTNYNGVTYAKAEIHAKHIEGASVSVEYKIKVTNNGELPGYVKTIVDYKPVDLIFDSNMNSEWYQEGDNLYSNSLADTKLEAGDSCELTLILTKQITENNMGLVNNLAEIKEASTPLGIEDTDSTPGNKERGEDDLGSADLSIGIKTGATVSYIIFAISSVVILIIISYFISMKIINKRKKI